MQLKSAVVLAVGLALLASGCLTSEESFYQDSDIKVDDQLVGDYRDESQTPTHFNISKVSEFDHNGEYYVTIGNNPGCSMKFGAVLFQVGTNRFLDMLPQIEACDHVAASPPSLIELLQGATLQPMHMAVKVEVSTNGVKLGFATHPDLVRTAVKFPEYFRPLKPEQLPRMVADM